MLRLLPLLLLVALTPATGGLTPARVEFSPAREAAFCERLDHGMVRCVLCPHQCVIAPGGRGLCRVRENSGGRLYSLVYGRPCTIGKEPIEKAPFFHFLPGATRITLATAGCNQTCRYCQNWELSQSRPEDLPAYDLSPADVVAIAKREQAPVICLTYSEPVVFFEYVCDIARLARPAGIRTAVVTGGYINPEPLRELCGLVDAVKIDLKGFSDDFYRDVCGSTLAPVMEACRVVHESGTHLEIVNLVVPGLNDDTATIRRMCRWVRDSLAADVPLHFTRFSPAYRLVNAPPTPVATLERAVAVADEEGLRFVYVGNVPGHRRESTFCPACGSTVVARHGYGVESTDIVNGRCRFCGAELPGVWQ